MRKFKLLSGRHVDEDGRLYDASEGEQIITSNRDLAATFHNKFVEVTEAAAPRTATIPNDPKNEDEKTDHGEDVTSKFTEAEEADLKVFKKGNTYTIVDPDDDSVIATASKKGDVATAIENFLQDEES